LAGALSLELGTVPGVAKGDGVEVCGGAGAGSFDLFTESE
jgi:hypothetical protein